VAIEPLQYKPIQYGGQLGFKQTMMTHADLTKKHSPSTPDVRSPRRKLPLLICHENNLINILNGVVTTIYFHEESKFASPPNNMLNGEIASTYLHQGWISISDKIYLLHSFHSS
jgi:hypothetical protein